LCLHLLVPVIGNEFHCCCLLVPVIGNEFSVFLVLTGAMMPTNLAVRPIHFKRVITRVYNPATALACRVVSPVLYTSRASAEDTWKCTIAMLGERRRWFDNLVQAGLVVGDDAKYFLRNCPPSTCVVTPRIHPCKLRVCPFCWSRSAIKAFDRLMLRMPFSCITVGYVAPASSLQLRVDPTDPAGQLCAIWKTQVALRKKMQQQLQAAGATGIYTRLTIEPPLGDDVTWRVCHRALVALSTGDDVVLPSLGVGWTVRSHKPTKRSLLHAVAYVLRYPLGWFRGEPALIVSVAEALKPYPCCSATGIFRTNT